VGAVWTAKLLVGIVWLFILIIVIVGNVVNRNKENLFQAPTPVSEEYGPPPTFDQLHSDNNNNCFSTGAGWEKTTSDSELRENTFGSG
jgi:hypothetical protein